MIDWRQIYDDTLVSKKYAYFDSGAAAPPPQQVISAVKAYLDNTAELGIYLPSFRKETYAYVETCRQKMAHFINATEEEIAFTKNGTESICLIARSIDWQVGDEVILPDTEMLSNLSIWHLLAKEKKINIIQIKANKYGLIQPEAIEQAITSKTRLITFVALSNITGAIQPIKAICDIAKKYNVLTHINAAQALGMFKIDVNDWQCDFLSACGRKGLRAIEGTGILFARHSLIPQLMPMLVGWWNSTIDNQSNQILLPTTAKRFEAGCPNVPAIYSLGAALDYANKIGIDNIENRNKELTRYAINKLKKIENFEIYGPADAEQRLGIIPFNIKGIPSDHLMFQLEKNNIIIESGHFMASAILAFYQIEKMARISLHYFNREEEIDNLYLCIKKIIKEYQQ